MTSSLSHLRSRHPETLVALAIFLAFPCRAAAQSASSPTPESHSTPDSGDIRDLQAQISELKQILVQMNAEMVRSREETKQLREELKAVRQQVSQKEPGVEAARQPMTTREQQETAAAGQASTPSQEERLKRLEEQVELQQAALGEQNQTKIESASKFHVRLSGIVLFNVINNVGAVDNLDFPSLAVAGPEYAAQGSFGMSLRQSLIGLEVFGPSLGGAHVSGDVQFDFAGGFADTPNGAVLGLPRFRTGVIRISGSKTDLVVGQDTPFFSPLSPTSFASTALPAFSYSGNLWTWTPQVRVEHRFDVSEKSKFVVQGGILDPLAGEMPAYQGVRVPGPGEASRIPAFATRLAWSYTLFDRELTVGAGGYYSRQDWGFDRHTDAWAGTLDWLFPLSNRWELSGEFYRGRGLGGLGGGLGRSVVADGSLRDPSTDIQGLDAEGGWAQLKFRQTEKLEWNAAFGEDDSFAGELREYPFLPGGYLYPSVARNRGSLGNFIYRPRSDLVFSLEYRHLRTFMIQGPSQNADSVNVAMGILF